MHKDENRKYPGIRAATDGNTAVISCERESSDAAGAFPITPSTQMGEYWAEASAEGHINISGRPLIFIEPEGEHAAAAVTAGLSMSGLRSANFSSGQGIAYMHESLYAAVGKRLTYVLNMGTRAMTKATLNVHAGHDDYHCADDTGFFQLFAKNGQHAADLNIIAHRIAETALNPGIVAQDGFLTTHLIESLLLPERELIEEFLGRPDDIIPTPTPAQKIIFGDSRRRIPLLWDVDNPIMSGIVENQDSYMQSVAAQRPYFFDHIAGIAEEAFAEFYQLTGRRYSAVLDYRAEDAEYLIVGQGSVIPSAEAVADYLRESRDIKVGVVNMLMFRPFPAAQLSHLLEGKKGIVVLERVDQPLAAELPLMREVRSTVGQCIENGMSQTELPYPDHASYSYSHIPPLYSGSFGLGSRDLQPEGLIAAVENMLPDGKKQKRFYLGIDFIHKSPLNPKQEIYQQQLEAVYPHVADLALHGSENPNLMPPESITVRMHSVGGWGAITTGKNLAMTLYDLLGYDIKANPKYGAEKKGQPTTYYLSAAPEPIRVNCEYNYVDVVLSPDPNVFHHTNALLGLNKGGVMIIQSEVPPKQLWEDIPPGYQKYIVDNDIRLFYLDAFKIAREEATDPELELRMQGAAFEGAFFAATPVVKKAGLDDAQLIEAIRRQLQHKFGSKGARVVEDNMRVIKRGFDEVQEVTEKPLADSVNPATAELPAMPIMLKRMPQSEAAVSDTHRFWEQTGSLYARGVGGRNLADPFISLGVMPAASAVFRDMTGIRFHHPHWIAENCTACGNCYSVCPDTAIPGLVSDLSGILDTVVTRVKGKGNKLKLLPKAVRQLETKLNTLLKGADEKVTVRAVMDEAIDQLIHDSDDDTRAKLETEFDLFRQELGPFQMALTRLHYTLPEKREPGTGGIFNISIDPYTCKGCGECIDVCPDDALVAVPQTDDTIKELRNNWDLWLDLPNTPQRFLQVEEIEEAVGPLHTMLLNKDAYLAFTSGDGACMGCSEKTVLRLFTATVETLMQARVKKHVAYLKDLIGKVENHIQLKLVEEIDVDNTKALSEAITHLSNKDLTLAGIAAEFEQLTEQHPIDPEWLQRITHILAGLKKLSWQYTQGTSGHGRTSMGILNATGCSSVWGSTYPFNPYPFPWSNHLFQDSASMAMGVFEGHMAKMAEGFKAIRRAELELSGEYNAEVHEPFLTYFNWQQFSNEEFLLCPPVTVVGGDGALYDIGFQNLSRAMMSGKPLKVVVLDTQVYSNTGGQACTSGFFGQVSDMAPYGKVKPGKQEVRKEIALIGMAHRTTYVMQSTIAYPHHMIEGFIEGLNAQRPALFNCYTSCQPEHGIGDDMGHHQAKLAVESRAYPLFRYNPELGKTAQECFSLDGNPSKQDHWPVYKLDYVEGGQQKKMELPFTFADFAMTEGRFRKHFRVMPPDTWNENMVPVADYLELDEEERQEKVPYIWSLDRKQHLSRLMVSDSIIKSMEDRRDFWTMLKGLAGIDKVHEDPHLLEEKIRREVVSSIAGGLMQWAGGEAAPATVEVGAEPSAEAIPAAQAEGEEYMAPWLDTDDCTACGECIKINPDMFAYNENEKAYIKNPDAGPYQDLVRAAERCTAQVIHPGLPRRRDAKDIEKWIKRAEKYNS
jgi:pyruvate-ferredoxin/flavodoxin oxidoreductase